MSATIDAEYDEDCRCSDEGCPTWAHITEWSCGRVKVEIHHDSTACSGCSRFSDMRRYCAKGEAKDEYPDGTSM